MMRRFLFSLAAIQLGLAVYLFAVAPSAATGQVYVFINAAAAMGVLVSGVYASCALKS